MHKADHIPFRTSTGVQLHRNKFFTPGEILVVFIIAFTFIACMKPFVAGKPVLQQAVTWIANILMLWVVWLQPGSRACHWHFR